MSTMSIIVQNLRRVAFFCAGVLWLSASAQAAIVINEVDYDQPGVDNFEFIELFNNGATAASLANLSVRLVNGNGSTEYAKIILPSTLLPAGGYFVICGLGSAVANCDLPGLAASDAIQNGAPDGIALVDDTSRTVLGSLSYEGNITAATLTGIAGSASLVNGAPLPVSVADDNVQADIGLSRIPNGLDTHNDATDWRLAQVTPGAANFVTAVPEPDTWAILVAGLGLIGLVLRRKTRPAGV
jgi:hypothetical protein